MNPKSIPSHRVNEEVSLACLLEHTLTRRPHAGLLHHSDRGGGNEVTEYIEKIDQPWQVEVCKCLRQSILQTVPDIEEVKLYNRPHYKKKGRYLCIFFVAKKWVNVTLFNASGLLIPQGYGELSGNGDRVTAKILAGKILTMNCLPDSFNRQLTYSK